MTDAQYAVLAYYGIDRVLVVADCKLYQTMDTQLNVLQHIRS